MDFGIKKGNVEQMIVGCVIVGVFQSQQLTAAAARIDSATTGMITNLIKSGDMRGKQGQTLIIHNPVGIKAERLLIVGCGVEQELTEQKYKEIINKALEVVNDTGAKNAVNCLTELSVPNLDLHWKVRHAASAALEQQYRFDQLKSKAKTEPVTSVFDRLDFASNGKADETHIESAIKEAVSLGKALKLTKDLANLPGNICTPSYLAEQATLLQKTYPEIKTKVMNEAQILKLGMGAFYAVARGSREPLKFITMEYKPIAKQDPIVLVGKGITFDTGGISIKPAATMDEMKFDMCGAASVLGTMLFVAEMKLGINVIGVIPTTENMPGGNAVKPGDIVTSMSGQTIEILNTDAEGRLILCDALTYVERFKPAAVIDIATLTGACVVALGAHASGLLSNNQDLTNELLVAGKQCGDQAWQLPLWDEYQKQLDSPFADMANVGGREAGTITAACFLSRFAKQFKWAHLDIAGTAWRGGSKKGATGRPVPLLVQYLLEKSKSIA